MRTLRWLNDRGWPQRWSLKFAAGLLLTVVVLFPRLDRLPISLSRHANPNGLIEPTAPALQPLIEEFDSLRAADWDDARMLKEVQTFVHRQVPYEWDWNIWSNADYFPTVAEVLGVGREDCDGRAVIAASLLRHYGYHAELATDIKHVWVETEHGATMGPGKVTAVRYSDEGPGRINWAILRELPGALSMGIAVFPLGRELILVTALWILLLGRPLRPRKALVWLLLMLVGLLVIREGGHPRLGANALKQWTGLAVVSAAIIGLIVHQRRASLDQGP